MKNQKRLHFLNLRWLKALSLLLFRVMVDAVSLSSGKGSRAATITTISIWALIIGTPLFSNLSSMSFSMGLEFYLTTIKTIRNTSFNGLLMVKNLKNTQPNVKMLTKTLRKDGIQLTSRRNSVLSLSKFLKAHQLILWSKLAMKKPEDAFTVNMEELIKSKKFKDKNTILKYWEVAMELMTHINRLVKFRLFCIHIDL